MVNHCMKPQWYFAAVVSNAPKFPSYVYYCWQDFFHLTSLQPIDPPNR